MSLVHTKWATHKERASFTVPSLLKCDCENITIVWRHFWRIDKLNTGKIEKYLSIQLKCRHAFCNVFKVALYLHWHVAKCNSQTKKMYKLNQKSLLVKLCLILHTHAFFDCEHYFPRFNKLKKCHMRSLKIFQLYNEIIYPKTVLT